LHLQKPWINHLPCQIVWLVWLTLHTGLCP